MDDPRAHFPASSVLRVCTGKARTPGWLASEQMGPSSLGKPRGSPAHKFPKCIDGETQFISEDDKTIWLWDGKENLEVIKVCVVLKGVFWVL